MFRLSLTLIFGSFATFVMAAEKPNIIFIMADDLGYGDLGCYGQTKIKTPELDKLAKQGMRFTDFYAGTAVCAPTRCSLMTGMHTGHTYIRANSPGYPNDSQMPIPADTETIATMLKRQGYNTACIGKWGLGTQTKTPAIRRNMASIFSMDITIKFMLMNTIPITCSAMVNGSNSMARLTAMI